jgi:hypothetical protein
MYGHVASIGELKMDTIFWLKNLKGIGGKIILEWILRKQGGRLWTGWIWPGIGASGVLL